MNPPIPGSAGRNFNGLRQREQVAEMRRALPTGAAIKQDYIFQEGPANLAAGDKPVREVRLSQLFTAPNRSLVL